MTGFREKPVLTLYSQSFLYPIGEIVPQRDVRRRIRAFVPRRKKPRDPINEPSRCNTQEGLLSVAQTGDSDLL